MPHQPRVTVSTVSAAPRRFAPSGPPTFAPVAAPMAPSAPPPKLPAAHKPPASDFPYHLPTPAKWHRPTVSATGEAHPAHTTPPRPATFEGKPVYRPRQEPESLPTLDDDQGVRQARRKGIVSAIAGMLAVRGDAATFDDACRLPEVRRCLGELHLLPTDRATLLRDAWSEARRQMPP